MFCVFGEMLKGNLQEIKKKNIIRDIYRISMGVCW